MAESLLGLALRHYRAIGAELQTIAPLKRINLFIGANNVGKSTILKYINDHLSRESSLNLATRERLDVGRTLDMFDAHQLNLSLRHEAYIAVDSDEIKKKVQDIKPGVKHPSLRNIIDRLFQYITDQNGLIWIKRDYLGGGEIPFVLPETDSSPELTLTSAQWLEVWHYLTSRSGGNLTHNWIPESLHVIFRLCDTRFAAPVFIPAIRQIGPTGEQLRDQSGRGLIDRLAEVQSPTINKLRDRDIFAQIKEFVRDVTDDEGAEINIPHNREHIIVRMSGMELPLESFGTGIHEVVMIAAFCTLNDGRLICMEEPEIHLHPILQRKLMRYLIDRTRSQFFIATHSSSLIDTPDASVFHVSHDGIQSKIHHSALRPSRLRICIDLGHRASDILQSNCIIWVEGPSDRIYIRHWIWLCEPKLTEGIHYSIMFYGGRLLSHLSADDSEVRDFIDLRSINQNIIIVIDSDKKAPADGINETKARVVSEFQAGGGVAWVTAGREIENYVPYELLQKVVENLYVRTYQAPLSEDLFTHSLYFQTNKPDETSAGKAFKIEKDVDKVKVAREVCEKMEHLYILDLEDRIKQICTFIEKCNHL